MKVRIAFATKSDDTVDVERIGSIEDHPDGDAKNLIKQGIAAAATDQDIADWDAEQARRKQIAAVEAGKPTAAGEEVEQPASARKVRRNRISGQLEDDSPDGPIVTVEPIAESSPDPADHN